VNSNCVDNSKKCILPADFAYRAMPFWAWNGKLDPQELRRQVRIMHAMGMNGFFMHSRLGLATDYLQQEWFDCIKAALDEAEKLGMTASLYDEDRWPSGAAGGLITADERYRMRYLYYEMLPAGQKSSLQGETLGFYAVERDGDDVKSYRMITPAEAETLACDIVRIYRVIAPSIPGYNNAAYLNTLDKDAVKAFIDLTHERYHQEIGEKFGTSVPFIFTDEPNYMDYAFVERRPWSDNIPELYQQTYQEELIPFLPELFFSCSKEFSTVRYNFYKLVTRLLTDAFAKQIGEWCQKHNIGLTGHVLGEDSPSFQVAAVGSAMQFYRYMQAPGIDVLTQYYTRYELPIKAASVARQYGKKYVLSECYGCTGWDFPLYGHKASGDWQYALGVNLRCQHLYWYTMLGEAKRDYPASIGGQSPWHEVYHQLEDYFARLGSAFAQAPAEIDLLVLYPLESAWGKAGFCKQRLQFAVDIDKAITDLTLDLVCNHIPFDFGDEQILADTATSEGGRLQVNQVSYTTLLLPELHTIRATTVRLLEEFCRQGGKVFAIGNAPEYCDGRALTDDSLKILWSKFIPLPRHKSADMLTADLRKFSCCDSDGREIGEILLRSGFDPQKNCYIMFAANTGAIPEFNGLRPPTDGKLRSFDNVEFAMFAPENMQLQKIDPADGTARAVADVNYDGSAYRWRTPLAGNQSCLYRLVTEDEFMPVTAAPQFTAELPVKFINAELTEKNLLVLDHATCRINGDTTMENMYILTLDDQLRELLGSEKRSGNMLQPWFAAKLADHAQRSALPIELEFDFECGVIPADPIELIIEQPGLYTICLNGVEQSNQVCGYWCDPALSRVKLDLSALRCGKNILTLACDYSAALPGLEAIYLAGDFGVALPDKLIAPQLLEAKIAPADLAIPYYAGNMIYNFEFTLDRDSPVEITADEWAGSGIALSIDRSPLKLLLSPPWKLVSDKLSAGRHSLQIKLYGSCRNAMGPFYLDPMPDWIGPNEFKRLQTQDKQLVPFGLQSLPEICCTE